MTWEYRDSGRVAHGYFAGVHRGALQSPRIKRYRAVARQLGGIDPVVAGGKLLLADSKLNCWPVKVDTVLV